MGNVGHFKKSSLPESLWVRYLVNCWMDRIQIWCRGSLDNHELINFWESFFENKMADVGHFENNLPGRGSFFT